MVSLNCFPSEGSGEEGWPFVALFISIYAFPWDGFKLTHGDHNSYAAFQQLTNATDMDAPYESVASSFSTDLGQAAARRIRQTRQRLGSYRHDLVVAMRVVNSIEREMIESEWEVWLTDETARCNQLKMVLDRGKGGGHRGEKRGDKAKRSAAGREQDQKAMASGTDWSENPNDSERRAAALRTWHESYCGSCEREHLRVMEARGPMGL